MGSSRKRRLPPVSDLLRALRGVAPGTATPTAVATAAATTASTSPTAVSTVAAVHAALAECLHVLALLFTAPLSATRLLAAILASILGLARNVIKERR